MAELRQRAEKICGTCVPVLMRGDGGTGKETLARWIHANSPCRGGEFVKVSCAAIPGGLLESELFGYEQGAFTGASNCKPGRVELAHKGTLFLDEIADVEIGLQSKLLHFLQDDCFTRIGGDSERKVDARVICASSKDLVHEISCGNFRSDLFYRINVVQLRLPRLRERREDIPLLAEFFRLHHERQFEMKSEPFRPELTDYLRNLDWPGNVRELSNSITRYVLLGPEAAFKPESSLKRIPLTKSSATGGTVSLKGLAKSSIKKLERNLILESLQANRWNRRKTAQALKISYRALIYKIRDANLV
jgi:two-component system response regulator AtoC